jgi:BirA family biotin operon repressor/biotin-[acetyl-CoA-carboxylase] ligase
MSSSFAEYVAELRALREGSGRHGLDNLVALRRAVSTNRLAREIALDYESEGLELCPLLIVAWEQSGGRGRQARSWSSPPGRGVYATLLLPFADPRALQSLPLLVGVGLCRALAPHLPRRCRLKWPNDLLAEGEAGSVADPEGPRRRKLGGVLIETLVRPGEPSVAIVGFGVNRSHAGDELPPGATSLEREGGGRASLARLTWELAGGVMRELEHAGDTAYAVDAYRASSIHHPGERISFRVGDEVVDGVFLGFDEHGLLRLASAGRELAFSAGEVIEP